jgi:hypothetical protein
MAKSKPAAYKRLRAPRVAIGRNQDAGFAIQVAITDQRAAIFQPYQHPKAQQKIAINFADHDEVVTRGIWQQFIQQNAQRVTEPDVDLVSVQQARTSTSVYVALVGHNQPTFQVLRVAPRPGARFQKMPTLQTRYLMTAPELGEWVRKFVATTTLRPFTFEMYTMLRWLTQPERVAQLEHHGRHWVMMTKEHHDGLPTDQVAVLEELLHAGLLVDRQATSVVSDTGIALLNYFARFYEGQFANNYGEAGFWRSDDLLVVASADTVAQFSGRSRKRANIKLPNALPKKKRGDRWYD